MNSFEDVLLNFGLAGATILIFYKLMSSELRELKESVKENTKVIANLMIEIKKLNKCMCSG